MIIASPLSVFAAVAIPNLMAARIEANERAAITTLRHMTSAQAQFAEAAIVDRDRDGVGEYGTIGELTGAAALPDGTRISPPVLATLTLSSDGRYEKNGYYYRVFLPDSKGRAMREEMDGARNRAVDADAAELNFAIYAWPKIFGSSAFNTYVIDADGVVLQAQPNGRERPYQGTFDEPEGDAAFSATAGLFEYLEIQPGVRGGPRGVAWLPVD